MRLQLTMIAHNDKSVSIAHKRAAFLSYSLLINLGKCGMETAITGLKDRVGIEVTLSGWLYNLRSSGKLVFAVLRDGTGLFQCIVEKGKVSDELFEQLKQMTQDHLLIR